MEIGTALSAPYVLIKCFYAVVLVIEKIAHFTLSPGGKNNAHIGNLQYINQSEDKKAYNKTKPEEV